MLIFDVQNGSAIFQNEIQIDKHLMQTKFN